MLGSWDTASSVAAVEKGARKYIMGKLSWVKYKGTKNYITI